MRGERWGSNPRPPGPQPHEPGVPQARRPGFVGFLVAGCCSVSLNLFPRLFPKRVLAATTSKPCRTCSSVVCATARLDSRHDDQLCFAIEADKCAPVSNPQAPLAPTASQPTHIACGQSLDRREDPLAFVSREPAQRLGDSGRDDRIPLGQLRRQSRAPLAYRRASRTRLGDMRTTLHQMQPGRPLRTAHRPLEKPRALPRADHEHAPAIRPQHQRSRPATRPPSGAVRPGS